MIYLDKIFSQEIIDSWPEVFGEVEFNVVPLQYISAVMIKFNDGNTWEINTSKKDAQNDKKFFEKTLFEFYQQYHRNIDSVDFKLNLDKVRKDIERSTLKFLKKRHL